MSTGGDDLLHRVIILAAVRRDARLTEELLAGAHIQATSCSDVEQVCHEMGRGVGVVILAQEIISVEFLRCMREALGKQPPWSDPPVVVLTRSRRELGPLLEQMAALANVTFLERPVRMGTLLSVVRAGLRARRRQLDEFLAMLGHELRNPLGAIQNAVQLVMSPRQSPEVSARAKEIVERQMRHLSRIVDDVLDVSRLKTGKVVLDRQPVELRQLVQRWVQMFGQTETVREHQVDVVTPAHSIYVDGDPVRLEQVLSNLMSNAIKYTPRGGRIRLSLQRIGDEALLSVEDNGVGIEADMLPRVFDLFAQAESTLARSQGGLGLGLALVQSLVLMHGGSVLVRSEGRGKGSVFDVRLPVLVNALETASEVAAEPRCRDGLRVVVVEDNDDARETLQMVLESEGHQVEVAASGKSGLDLIVASRPDVALVDIGLPELNGYEVARHVRRQLEKARVQLIAMTGYGQPDDRRRAMEAGFDRHLVKPLQVEALRSVLDECAECLVQ